MDKRQGRAFSPSRHALPRSKSDMARWRGEESFLPLEPLFFGSRARRRASYTDVEGQTR